MNIFNSLGSNYDFSFVLKALFADQKEDDASLLIEFLEDKYKGKVSLVYKGREAIELALRSLELPKDSVVAFNGFTCYVVYKAVVNAGLSPEYIDITSKSLDFSSEAFSKALKNNPKIRVLLIQNTLGYPCDIEAIAKICKEKRIILIEDLAHSVGTRYADGKEAGTIGDFTILSFSQDKIIDAISGGALIVRNPKYEIKNKNFEKVPLSRQIKDRRYPLFTFLIRKTYSLGIGKIVHGVLKKTNMLSQPMDNLAEGIHTLPAWYSTLAYKQFRELEKNILHRKKIATIYAKNLDISILLEDIVKKMNNSTNLRFPIVVSNRKEFIAKLKDYGVFVSDIWYDAPIAPKKYITLTNYTHQAPNAEKVSEKIVNLPTHKNISEKQAVELSQKINLWLKSQLKK